MKLLHQFFERLWYHRSSLRYVFWLPAKLFLLLSTRRRQKYLSGQSKVFHPPVPVIVVGNINVGGTGKTPLTIWLIDTLRKRGYKPGVVSRGYGGNLNQYPYPVSDTDSAVMVGDEPLMIHLRTGAPVMIDPDRASAARALIKGNAVDVIISDDGLQHYRLARTLELVVVDGQRGFGNQSVLPMGPLREPVERIREVDAVVVNGGAVHSSLSMLFNGQFATPCFEMRLAPGNLIPLNAASEIPSLQNAAVRVKAVAGIGNPQRFFETLSAMSLVYDAYAFPDHHQYTRQDLSAIAASREHDFIVTTEKDAVKMRPFAEVRGAFLPVNAELQEGLIDVIMAKLEDFKVHHCHHY